MLPRICLLHANQPEAAYVYVNIRNCTLIRLVFPICE